MKKSPPAKRREVKEAPANYMAGQRGSAPNLLAQRNRPRGFLAHEYDDGRL